MELIRYSEGEVDVRLGDHVTYKSMYFWRDAQPGRVIYVPGQSPVRAAMEHDGMYWIGVAGDDGTHRRGLIDPVTFQVQPTIRFQRRSEDDALLTPGHTPEGDR